MSNQQCAYLVCSCDKYKDLWDLHFESIDRFLPELGLRKFLMSNYIECKSNEVTSMLSGEDVSWSHMLINCLSKLDFDYILLTLDDFISRSDGDSVKLKKAIQIISENESIGMIRLIPRPGGTSDSRHRGFSTIELSSPYSLALQASLWKKDYLLSLLREGETPWEFEKFAKERSSPKTLLCSDTDILGYKHHCVQRGKFFPWDKLQFSRKFQAPIIRPTLSIAETAYWFLTKFVQRVRFILK